MKRLLLALFFFPALLGAVVMHISELPPELAHRALPDVMGMVIVDDTSLSLTQPTLPRTPPEVWDGWPVARSGYTIEGGIPVDIDGDGTLEVLHNVGTWCCVYQADGTMRAGWPQEMTYQNYGAPAFGDVDGDGQGEIVSSGRIGGTGNAGCVFAWEIDGSVLPGFPTTPGGGPCRTPTLGDLDMDGDLEIIIGARNWPDGFVYVYQGDGSVMTGWPQQMDHVPASSAACGDITGDGVPEVIIEALYTVWAFNADGTVLDGWPYDPDGNRVYSYSSPVLADLDNDGVREVIVGDHCSSPIDSQVHCLYNDGTLLPGWPQTLGYWIFAPVAVGDIDGDGAVDLAVGDQVLSNYPATYMNVWDVSGNPLPGWPVGPIWSINTQAIIADLDGDGLVELMWDDNTGSCFYLGYNHDATPMDDWPLSAGTGTTFFNTPAVADIDGDGFLDIMGLSTSGDQNSFYVWSTDALWNEYLAHSQMHMCNPRHDGVYGISGPPPTLYGDVDGDEVVTEADADIVLDYAAGLDPIPEIDPRPWEADLIEVADVDTNGVILAFDAALILQYAEGLIDSFPVEQSGWTAPDGDISVEFDGGCYLEFSTTSPLYSFDILCEGEDAGVLYDFEWVNTSGSLVLNTDAGLWQISGVPDNPVSMGVFLRVAVDMPVTRDYDFHFDCYVNRTDVPLDIHVPWNGIDEEAAAATPALSCSPNPFNPRTTVHYTLVQPCEVELAVYNVQGRRVCTLVEATLPAGMHQVDWGGLDAAGQPVASGVYLLRLEGPGVRLVRKTLLLK
ncbi:MAG: T9SS type A sorting domain-containing protein [Candidatus Cloacimonetes bacterium]|nr:T9SS type A sorting domain-containing protein [Candidatus Cloacimonadota bacterium]